MNAINRATTVLKNAGGTARAAIFNTDFLSDSMPQAG